MKKNDGFQEKESFLRIMTLKTFLKTNTLTLKLIIKNS